MGAAVGSAIHNCGKDQSQQSKKQNQPVLHHEITDLDQDLCGDRNGISPAGEGLGEHRHGIDHDNGNHDNCHADQHGRIDQGRTHLGCNAVRIDIEGLEPFKYLIQPANTSGINLRSATSNVSEATYAFTVSPKRMDNF